MNSEKDTELESRQELEMRQKGEDIRVDESIRVQSEDVDARAITKILKQEIEKVRKERIENQERLEKERKERLEKEQKDTLALEQETREFQEKITRLREKGEELDNAYSLKMLFETHSGLPAIEKNTAAEPLTGGKLKSKRIRMMWSDKRSKPYHAPTHIVKMNEKVLDYIDRFEVNFKQKNGQLVKSLVALKMGENNTNKEATLANFNEFSVSLHVLEVLNDVLQCLHLFSCARVCQERSIFSMRPDIIVVRWLNRIILVVEVKSPGKDGNEVVSNEWAAGQIYDYAMGLRQMGIDHPFVCLSTYDHMRIGTLQKSSEEIFEKATRRLGENGAPVVSDQLNEKQLFSSEKEGNLVEIPDDSTQVKHGSRKKIIDSIRAKLRNNKKIIDMERVIHFSETFDLKNSFKALYYAIVCGIVAVEKSINGQERKLVPEEGEDINQFVAFVTKTSLRWEILRCKATYQLTLKWDTCMKVYLHCVLGYGCSGKVYLASDSKGQMFAVKLYLFVSKRQRGMAWEARNTEARRWRMLYPHCRRAIHRGELNGVPCLAMPYVASIPANRRKCLLPSVRQELERLVHKGFAYSESILRWHQIGMRTEKDGKEQIIWNDLGSLENQRGVLSVKELHDLVRSQIEELKRRAPRDPVYAAQELIHP